MILIICLICNGALLWTFTFSYYLAILFINRIAVGVFQSYIVIYFPLWCDQYGIKKKKAMMIAILQTGVPLGIVVGYAMTSVIKESFQVIN
jgi:hypothetical protein